MRILVSGAYRLLFPAAGLFAALAVTMWLVLYSGNGAVLPLDGVRWHQHEMLFGYLGVALGGFLLTAIPNWTGRPAVVGLPLLAIFAAWLLGRVGFAVLPAGVVRTLLVLMFPFVLAAVASRDIWAGGNRRNMPVAIMVWVFAAADAVFLTGHEAFAQRMGFGLALVLISLVGGRITPAFSRNWLKGRGSEVTIPMFGWVDAVAMGTAAGAAIIWAVRPDAPVTGYVSLIAAVALMLRLVRWHTAAVVSEPLLWALHLAYAWLPVSFALLGASILGSETSHVQVVHAIGAGAVGGMTLIVMMRAILGHANRPIAGDGIDVAIIVAVHLGAAVRVAAPLAANETAMVYLSGTLWSLGFAMFFLRYGRIALLPRL